MLLILFFRCGIQTTFVPWSASLIADKKSSACLQGRCRSGLVIYFVDRRECYSTALHSSVTSLPHQASSHHPPSTQVAAFLFLKRFYHKEQK